jgi:hypothetical protein
MAIPTGPALEYVRGDLAPLSIIFKQSGVAVDFTGYTAFELTINPANDPADASGQHAQFQGTAATPTNGTVDFVPDDLATSDALVPESYFYDVQALDAGGQKVTLLLGGSFVIKQDINKD